MSPTSVPFTVGLSKPPNLIGIRGSEKPCLQCPYDMIQRTPLQHLEGLLAENTSKIALLQGMRGVGKSATIATLLYNRLKRYVNVWFLTIREVRQQFENLAHQIIPELFKVEGPSQNVIQRVYRALAVWGPVAIIFDDIERLSDIAAFLPNDDTLSKCKELHVIITTCNSCPSDWRWQNRNFAESAVCIPVPLYSQEELLTYCRFRSTEAQAADLNRTNPVTYPARTVSPTEQELEHFGQEVGCLPVAVTAACNAILDEQTYLWPGEAFGLGDLLNRIVAYDTELPGQSPDADPKSLEYVFFLKLRSMWGRTFEKMDPESLPALNRDPDAPGARELLDLSSLVMPRGLPLEVIRGAWPRRRGLLKYLQDRDLVSVDVGTRTVYVFPLLLKKIRDLKNTGRSPGLPGALEAMENGGFAALQRVLQGDAISGCIQEMTANLQDDRVRNIEHVRHFVDFLAENSHRIDKVAVDSTGMFTDE